MNRLNKLKRKRKAHAPRLRYPLNKSIALIGLMGSGKTTIGVRLARRLGLPFVDSDAEIEIAAGHTVNEIFEKFGEEDFRVGERKVIDRLISDKPSILGTGGGAYMDRETRKRLNKKTITVWLKADIKSLVERTGRRNTRPLLKQGNPQEILTRLARQRYPVYGQSDITVETGNGPHEHVVNNIIHQLNHFLALERKKNERKKQERKKHEKKKKDDIKAPENNHKPASDQGKEQKNDPQDKR